MPAYEELLRICVKYTGDRYYVAETIPDKKLTNARAQLLIPTTERIVALLDTTAFGSAKNAVAIGENNLYWRDLWSEPKKLTWEEVASAAVRRKGRSEVEVGENYSFQASGALKVEDVVCLLLEIRALVGSPDTAATIAVYDDLRRTCVRYKGNNYYTAEAIPRSKLANARSSFPIPADERVVALLDTTIFGSGRTGLAITEAGLRWRNGLNTWAQGPKQMFLPWDEFISTAPINHRGVLNVSVRIGLGGEFAWAPQT